MSATPRSLSFLAILLLSAITACGGGGKSNLLYPMINPTELENEFASCNSLDRRLRQVDSIRWSVREDGVELETEFEQLVQLSVATVIAIGVAVPLIAIGSPDPTFIVAPYAIAYTGPDYLKQLDALLIAMMRTREELQCPPHLECAIRGENFDMLTALRTIREQVENKKLAEQKGLEEVTALLDKLCPVGTRYLPCPNDTEDRQFCTGKVSN